MFIISHYISSLLEMNVLNFYNNKFLFEFFDLTNEILLHLNTNDDARITGIYNYL